MPKKNIGIIAFQGGVIEHSKIIKSLGHKSIEVREVKDLDQCDSLIIPGGESTTIGFFMEETGLMQAIRKRALHQKHALPIWGTCAGAIILAKKIKCKNIPPGLKLLDMEIERNAYGTQSESFYTDLEIPKLKITNLNAAFIRAPVIKKVGPKVEILAMFNNQIVLVRQKKLLASTFHPELRNNLSLHDYFCNLK